MQHRTPAHIETLDDLTQRVISLDNMLARKDLIRMLGVARKLSLSLDRELVECRRLHRYTAHYDQLEVHLVEQIRTVGKWLTWAHLRF